MCKIGSMKYFYTYLKQIIFFSLSLYSSLSSAEYHHFANQKTPESKINFNIPEEKPQSPHLFPSHIRNWKLYNVVKNNFIQQVLPTHIFHQNLSLLSNISALSYVHNGFKAQRQNIITEFMYNNPDIHA